MQEIAVHLRKKQEKNMIHGQTIQQYGYVYDKGRKGSQEGFLCGSDLKKFFF